MKKLNQTVTLSQLYPRVHHGYYYNGGYLTLPNIVLYCTPKGPKMCYPVAGEVYGDCICGISNYIMLVIVTFFFFFFGIHSVFRM